MAMLLEYAVELAAEQVSEQLTKLLNRRVKAEVTEESPNGEPFTACFFCENADGSVWGQGRDIIAEISFSQMPGCCGVLVAHDGDLHEWSRDWSGKRIGSTIAPMCDEVARLSGYTLLMCTNILSRDDRSLRFKKIMARNGWEDVSKFRNKRTGNSVHVYVKKVSKKIKFAKENK